MHLAMRIVPLNSSLLSCKRSGGGERDLVMRTVPYQWRDHLRAVDCRPLRTLPVSRLSLGSYFTGKALSWRLKGFPKSRKNRANHRLREVPSLACNQRHLVMGMEPLNSSIKGITLQSYR